MPTLPWTVSKAIYYVLKKSPLAKREWVTNFDPSKNLLVMKKQFNLLMSLALTVLIASCRPQNEPPSPSTGAVTSIGTLEGAALTTTIGPAGGTVASADQRIQITIPAGALTENKIISVQPLTNQCPAGTGQAFRLMPHGLTFTKPAIISFRYDEQDINGSAPEVMRVAFQNDKGIWQSPKTESLDTTQRVLTIQTMHFSDWALYQTMYIFPKNTFLNPGGKVHMDVFRVEQPVSTADDDLFVPLPMLVEGQYIERWQLMGEGTLIHKQNKGDYFAPDNIPATNPAAISVFLKHAVSIEGQIFKDIRVVSTIFVAPEGITVQMEGGWQTYPGGANINSNQNVVTGKIGTESVSLLWKGGSSGTFRWTKSTDVAFNLLKGPIIYQHLYGNGPSVSGGSLKVDNSDETWVTGTFTVQPAGWIRPTTPPDIMGTANIKGVFRVKRVGEN
jgi:hypothetical protein